jgi:hypothetical protein
MRVKKFNGKPYGVELTTQERKALNLEINRQIAKRDEQYAEDIDALILYVLMARYGWKKKRLRKFWNAFVEEHKALREFYQMNEDGDAEWLSHRMLKDIGVDIHQWYEEDNKNE